MGPLATSLLILWLQPGWVSGQVVEQSPATLSLKVGESTTLNCTYTTSINSLQWYRHNPGTGPTVLFIMVLDGDEKQEGRLKATLSTKGRHSSLSISAAQTRDSATYFHSISGNQRLFWGSGTSLTVIPNIKDPQPALYQLTSPKSSDTSVCLLTDFDSSNTYTNGNDSTVLEMMTMESKSYGAVAWGSKSSFNCTNAFPQNIINLTQPSGSTCKVQDVEQSFETDKDLNLMNASLIFLRVIFLKTVGFNLLMTLRLWSN